MSEKPASPIVNLSHAKEPPFGAVLQAYLAKMVGVDMGLKCWAYILRLCILYSDPKSDRAKNMSRLLSSMIESRMLINYFRPIPTAKQAISAFQMISTKPGRLIPTVLTTLSLLLRIVEQLSSDLGYLQRRWFHQWDGPFFSKNYKRFKSFSLTCSAIVEMTRIYTMLKEEREMRKQRQQQHANALSADGHAQANSNVLSPNGQGKTTPPSVTPTSQFYFRFPPTASVGMNRVSCFDQTAEGSVAPIVRSSLMLARNVGDMYIYYKWIDSYEPNDTLAHFFGLMSGALAVYLIWWDTWIEKKKELHLAEINKKVA